MLVDVTGRGTLPIAGKDLLLDDIGLSGPGETKRKTQKSKDPQCLSHEVMVAGDPAKGNPFPARVPGRVVFVNCQ